MTWLRETWVVLMLGFRNVVARPLLPVIVVVGFLAVVLVMVSVLSIGHGLNNTFANTGSPDVAMVLSTGAFSEAVSHMSEANVQALASEPGVSQSSSGPVVSPELLTTVDIPKVGSGVLSNVIVRGVTADAFRVHSKVHLIAGHMFETGVHEVIVGRQAAREYQGLSLGSTLHFGDGTWTVVGIFAAHGDIHESEIWTDVHDLQAAFHMGDSYSSAYVELTSPAAFSTFAKAAEKDPRLTVLVQREKDFYAGFDAGASQVINVAGFAIAILMALGAIIGAVNLMNTHMAARIREMATLRAVGFGRASVLSAVLSEGLIFGLVGGVVFALIMGFIGGLFPAIRAARLPLAKALREA